MNVMFKNCRVILLISCILAWAVMTFGGTVAADASVAVPSSDRTAVIVYDRMVPVKNLSREVVSKATEKVAMAIASREAEAEPDSSTEEYTEEVYVDEVPSKDYVEEAPIEDSISEDSAPSYDGGYVNANVDGNWIAGSDFAWMGVHTDSGSGYSYTYYSENVLPGGGLSIPGRHVGDEGYVMDGNGNLCLASDDLPYGTVVSIPFGSGTGVVYDCGSGYGNLDVYVSW